MRALNTDHPLLFEVNARVRLAELSQQLGRSVTLAEVPEPALDAIENAGFDYVWLMGVWKRGPRARQMALRTTALHGAYEAALPGWSEADVAASPYAVADYTVDEELGGDAALAVLRKRLADRRIGLILDFVSNHVGLDHPWLIEQPSLFVRSSDGSVAHGRDPNFPPWGDTAQLDYRRPGTREAMIQQLRRLAEMCDGVRCDMAMLALNDVFQGTWSAFPTPEPAASGEFWADAISSLRRDRSEFMFIAEAYWDLEFKLQQLGFDYTYDKRLYDRLIHEGAPAILGHLRADSAYQRRSLRFIENHDEPRAASLWGSAQHKAAAVIALTIPGMRLFHMGQLEGLRRRLPVQLRRRSDEPSDPETEAFYERLLAALTEIAPRRGAWILLEAAPPVLGWAWDAGRFGQWLVVVNYSDAAIRPALHVPLAGLAGRPVELRDLLSDERMAVDGDRLWRLEVDLAPWQPRILELR